ncbi:hypothetical protein [Flavobacterium wongokense]|uniref:hypothetical protein n=1 Tax=Flavobacterium wongokense TaxID=2910674 RepID=UPI001F19EE3F|nr:hypothetical protein [Flavobacterium sp. WG47]MCF6131106.1 hypothetical protein [Flavobacterium sp. WG47]
MGCDITILSKHNLDITNVETLAVDISNKFGFSIEFGYNAFKEYNDLLGNDLDEDFISLGVIDKKPYIKKYKLIDEKFQQKQLYQKYGDEVFGMRDYWYWFDFDRYNNEMPNSKQIEQEKKDLQIAEFFLDNHSETGESSYMYIHNEIAVNDLHYYTRWWSFCDTIQKKHNFNDEYFQKYRLAVMKDTLLLGGDKAYFVNDQCKHLKGVGQGNEMYFNWQQLESYINDCAGLEVISISKTVLNKEYQREVENKKSDTLAFYDDFQDLKGIEN